MTGGAYSLRRRLLGWLLFSTAIIGTIALTETYSEAVKTANVVSDRVLAGSALAIAERVAVSEDGKLEVDIPYVALEMLTSAAQDRVFYRVDGAQGEFLTGYQGLPSFAPDEPNTAIFEDAAFRGEPIRVAVMQRSASTGINSVPFTVTVAETTIARRQLAQSILLRSALRLLAMIVGASIIVWVAVTISLRPLFRLSEAIAERNPSDLHPIDQKVPLEVQNLVDTVNSFMVRLKAALDALRHFTGNASHQLRTPLAIIRTQLALSERAETLAQAKAAARKGDESVAHAEHILAQLLRMAKIDATGSGEPQTLSRIDLVEVAQTITADYIPQAAEAGVDLGFEGEGIVTVLAEPLLIGELLGNLIGNAIAYAGDNVEVTVRAYRSATGQICLEVEDNGQGIAPEKRDTVRQRFARGEGNAAPGAGLGLAIVEEIALLFGGQLVLDSGQNGRGLKATVLFPIAR
ncbi:sensor histidine kinase [Agrobacterium sp.]|uniref:sensor histidine kinase n=1 Tax=Agrobacterium sp. TaxID=361 RepID=UPI0028A9F861|nr:sensor histidine kinase [Agrobacterium sp.]